jgi:hypothetical protein
VDDPKPDKRAMEEWKQLEQITGRYETQEYQVRGWLFVLLSVLGAALLAERSKISGPVFGVVGGCLVWVSCSMELVIRIPKRKAFKRVAEIEKALRGEVPYDGPRMSLALGTSEPIGPQMLAQFLKLRVWSFYATVFVIVILIGIVTI